MPPLPARGASLRRRDGGAQGGGGRVEVGEQECGFRRWAAGRRGGGFGLLAGTGLEVTLLVRTIEFGDAPKQAGAFPELGFGGGASGAFDLERGAERGDLGARGGEVRARLRARGGEVGGRLRAHGLDGPALARELHPRGGERVGERADAPARDGMGAALGVELAGHRCEGREISGASGPRRAEIRASARQGDQHGVACRPLAEARAAQGGGGRGEVPREIAMALAPHRLGVLGRPRGQGRRRGPPGRAVEPR